MRQTTALALALTTLAAAACAPRIRPLQVTLENGELVRGEADEVVTRARVAGEVEQDRLREQRGAAAATALATCAPEVCEAVARGELALGMTEAQVLAATRTTPQAWDARGGGRATLLTGRSEAARPRDAVAEIAWVSFQNGTVQSYTYREPQGYRTVATPGDATPAGRASAQAEALLRDGDAYAAQGELQRALDLYDRADILRPDHPETTLRIARVLDKSLRPVEAVLRYRLFIHQMELERLRAEGEVAARIAEAIARAHERIVVLERR